MILVYLHATLHTFPLRRPDDSNHVQHPMRLAHNEGEYERSMHHHFSFLVTHYLILSDREIDAVFRINTIKPMHCLHPRHLSPHTNLTTHNHSVVLISVNWGAMS